MKKMFFCIAMLAIACVAMGQAKPTKVAENQNTPKIKVEKVDNKTFKATKQSGTRGSGYQPTGYLYQDTDGNTYEIHTHVVSRGDAQGQTKCYIQRTSKKSGKTYWKEIPVKPEELR